MQRIWDASWGFELLESSLAFDRAVLATQARIFGMPIAGGTEAQQDIASCTISVLGVPLSTIMATSTIIMLLVTLVTTIVVYLPSTK